jgi:pilus assembly protein CpaD
MTLRPVLALVAVAGLAACSEPVNMADYDPHQRFQVAVESATATAAFADPMTATDMQVARDLAAEFVRRGAGPVAIEGRAAETVAQALVAAGIPPASIQARTTGDAGAVVRVPVWTATVPECGRWSEEMNPDFRDQNTANFGCAVTRNIGLMVSNPADLVRARDPSGRDANRSADVIDKYGQGKPTGAQGEAPAPTATISVVGSGGK